MSSSESLRRKKKPKSKAGRTSAETWRLKKLLKLEQSFWDQGIEFIAGVDEVGRGPLAGPVLAAAVIMPPGITIRGVQDSKLLSPEKREQLLVEIHKHAIAVSIGGASPREIDRINILKASHLAMKRALDRLRVKPQKVIVDGLPVRLLGPDHLAVIDGDAKVHCIACASIVAKVMRDKLMTLLAGRYPVYGWEHNSGYGTAGHFSAIESSGITPHHRRSFTEDDQLTLKLLQ